MGHTVAVWSITIVLLMLLLIPSIERELQKLLNALYTFNEFQMKFQGVKPSQIKDGRIVKIAYALLMSFASTQIFVGPAVVFYLSLDWKLFWLFSYPYFPGSHYFVALGAMYIFIVDAILLLFMLVGIDMYVLSEVDWLARNVVRNGENVSPVQKEKLQLICRAHCILARHLEEFIFYLIPAVVSGDLLLVITLLFYAIVDMYQVLNAVTIACFGMVAVTGLGFLMTLIQQCVGWTKNSKACESSFQELGNNGHGYSEKDKKFFRSVQPIIWRIGCWIPVDESLFPEILNFTLNTVIELLLSSELRN